MNARAFKDKQRAAATRAANDAAYPIDARLRSMLDSAPLHIAYYDANLVCRFANASYAQWFGLDPDRITGVELEKIVGDAVFAEVEPQLRRVLAGERVRYQRSQAKDGQRIHTIESVLVPHTEADGAVKGFFGFLDDITERLETEQAVRRSEQLKAATLAAALDAIVSIDHEGNIIEFNPAAERCFGYSRDEVIGRQMSDLLVPESMRQQHREGFARYLRTGEAKALGQRLVLPALRSDGTEIEIELAILRLPQPGPPVFTAFARDVTEVRRAEDSAQRSQERLERALEASGMALFDVDVTTGRVYLSENWAEMIGAAPGETHTSVRELLERVHPEERDGLWQRAKDAIIGVTDGYDVEHRVRREDGGWIWILSRSRVIERDAEGRSVRMAGTNVDITERKRAEQRMHYLATRDALTDLTNRALFGDSVQAAIEEAAGRPSRVALLAIGLDRFTTINDSLGHEAGDLVLKRVAERLTAAVAADCTVARPGGDEFLVLIPRVGSGREAAATAEVVRNALVRPIDVGGRELVVTASIGIALHPDDGDTAGLLLRNVNIALHNAKDAGRPSVQFFANRMNEVVRSRFDIEAALRLGVERGEFVLHYQPQVVLPSGVLTGFEALVRWQHPERGLLLPEEFIPIAESTGLIVPLGEWVIGAACREAAQWQRKARQPVRVAVNVSAAQLRDRRFVDIVQRALLQSRLDPHLLEIEITENMIMSHGREAIAMLEAVGRLGVQVAVDDFGTGYSSLSYLKRLPIDTVKIDKSFVADLAYDADVNAIVGAIVGLAHNLGLQVVAEGVETQAQSAILQRYGCDGAQGYMFGRPQPPERLTFGEIDDSAASELACTG